MLGVALSSTLGRLSKMGCVVCGRIHPTTEVVGFLLDSV